MQCDFFLSRRTLKGNESNRTISFDMFLGISSHYCSFFMSVTLFVRGCEGVNKRLSFRVLCQISSIDFSSYQTNWYCDKTRHSTVASVNLINTGGNKNSTNNLKI